jgi:Putative prokaryotic signal transducing protein
VTRDRATPRRDGRIVEMGAYPSRIEADAVAGMLQTNGIKATVNANDAEGWAPFYAVLHGATVLVFEEDLEAARAMLELEPPPPRVR